MSDYGAFIWESHWKGTGWVWELGGMGFQGITRREQTNGVSQVDEHSVVVPHYMCMLRAGESSTQNNVFFQQFCLGESCPSSPHAEAK